MIISPDYVAMFMQYAKNYDAIAKHIQFLVDHVYSKLITYGITVELRGGEGDIDKLHPIKVTDKCNKQVYIKYNQEYNKDIAFKHAAVISDYLRSIPSPVLLFFKLPDKVNVTI